MIVTSHDNRDNLRDCVVLFSLVIISFSCSLPNAFVNWDDYGNIVNNPDLRSGGTRFVKWAFTTFQQANWLPLTWFSHAIDIRLYGLNPIGHRFTNILIHGLNAILVALIVRRFFPESNGEKGNRIIALLAASLFAVHPLRVESVVWITERKDILCALFMLASIYCYLRYIASSFRAWFVVSVICNLLAVMSKPMAVSLPLVLVIIDWFFRRHDTISLSRLLMEKIPSVLCSILAAVTVLLAHYQQSALTGLDHLGYWQRILVAGKGYAFYLYKTLFPVNLAPYYPLRGPDAFDPGYVFPTLIVVMVTITTFALRGFREWKACWMAYGVTLLPVAGIIKVGAPTFAADRYSYLPTLPFYFLSAYLVGMVYQRCRKSLSKRIVVGICLLGIATLVTSTVVQSKHWKDTISLWGRVIDLYPLQSDFPYAMRGQEMIVRSNYVAAIDDLSTAISIRPLQQTINDRGTAYIEQGNLKAAFLDFDRSRIKFPLNNPFAYFNLSRLESHNGNLESACRYMETAFQQGFNNPSDIYRDRLLANLSATECLHDVLRRHGSRPQVH